MDHEYYEKTTMKKKEKDDILGEEQSDLPVNEGTSRMSNLMERLMTDIPSSWWLSQREMRLQESILLPITDTKRRRTPDLFLQGMLLSRSIACVI